MQTEGGLLGITQWYNVSSAVVLNLRVRTPMWDSTHMFYILTEGFIFYIDEIFTLNLYFSSKRMSTSQIPGQFFRHAFSLTFT